MEHDTVNFNLFFVAVGMHGWSLGKAVNFLMLQGISMLLSIRDCALNREEKA